MNAKSLKNILLLMGIPLLIASCGGEPPDTGSTPATLPNILKVKRISKTYVISGIGTSGSNTVAIINDQVVTPGMELDPGVVLKDVQPTYATILFGNKEYQIRPENIQSEMDKKKR